MFKFRSDGRCLKNVGPYFKLMPHIMKKRSDSQVFYSYDIPLSPIDEYLKKKDQEGIKLSYMHIIFTALIRLLAEKPCLNRFVMNGRVFARKSISLSLAIKKEMSETVEETTLKMDFTGSENIFEIKQILDLNIQTNKDLSAENETDALAKVLSHMPNFALKFCVNTLMFLDKHGLMPKSIIKASPFHTSVFLTNVGSLGLDSIYHHIYDFGTTGVFLAMGKKKKSYLYEDEELKTEKTISLSWVADERICDGYYYANCIKQFNKYLKKPELLEKNIIPTKDVD